MLNIFFAQAVSELRPGKGFTLDNVDYDTLVFADASVEKPSLQEIITKANEIKEAYEQKDYARNRALEYPSIGDQLDALFHAGVFPEEMAAKIQAIKDKYPKS